MCDSYYDEYPMLNLSMFASYKGKICCRCYSEHEASVFLRSMMEQYPSHTKFWSEGETHWGEHGSDYVDYFPYLNNVDGGSLCWDDESYAEDNDYYIVDFDDIPMLHQSLDLGDIPQSEMDVDFLLG